MISSLSRFLSPSTCFYSRIVMRHMNKHLPTINFNSSAQIEYIKSATESKVSDWSTLKNNVLDMNGNINKKNFGAIVLKLFVKHKDIDRALSFAEYLKTSGDMTIGSVNELLRLYYELGLENTLSDKDKLFILNAYNDLYEKYKVLDSTTCERLLHALCVINEWKKALKVLSDIHFTSKPSHSAYSNLIGMFFKLNKKKEAYEMIQNSIENRRPLQHIAYQEWVSYILRKYKDKRTILKHTEDVFEHIARNCAVVTLETAEMLIKTYETLGWNAQFTSIKKNNGQCLCCKDNLQCLKLTDEEFQLLQQNVKEKLIVGSDLFLKTSPEELKKFLEFLHQTVPYDIVIDALNVAYSVGPGHSMDRMEMLTTVVNYFVERNKKVLLLGRKHMIKWPQMRNLMSKTCSFFTDNLSQDDPYFITAAIQSGSHTDIMSKDLLRGHRFLLGSEQLQAIFLRWQWQHQWKVFLCRNRGAVIQEPVKVTPCAQKRNATWHIPYEKAEGRIEGQIHDGMPDWQSWICLRTNLPSR